MGNKGSTDHDAVAAAMTRADPAIVLLGSDWSGKSTIFRNQQVRCDTISPDAVLEVGRAIQADCRSAILGLIRGARRLAIPFPDDAGALEQLFLTGSPEETLLTPTLARRISTVWKSKEIQTVYSRRYELGLFPPLPAHTKMFLDQIQQHAVPKYMPSGQDLYRAHVDDREWALYTKASFGGKPYRLQMIPSFAQLQDAQDVVGIFFTVSLAEFDESISEENPSSRLLNSIECACELARQDLPLLTRAKLVILLTKQDIFAEKLKAGRSLQLCFPDYEQKPDDVNKSLAFIVSKFEHALQVGGARPTRIVVLPAYPFDMVQRPVWDAAFAEVAAYCLS